MNEEIIQKPYSIIPENFKKDCECNFVVPDCSIGTCYFENDGGLKRQMKYNPRVRYFCPRCGKELIKIK